MAVMRSIAANRAMETTETTGTGTYSLEGPVAGYTSFAGSIATGQLVGYCVQQIARDGNGDIIGADFEIGLGTLTHGAPDTLARTAVLESTNGDAAVNWGPGVKTIFATLPAQLVPMMAAALTSGQAGKALVVDATSRYFELGGPFLPLAGGGTVNGQIEIVRADNALILRDPRNTTTPTRIMMQLQQGDGSGAPALLRARGDGANGVDQIFWVVGAGGVNCIVRADGTMAAGADGVASGDLVRKGQMDAATAQATTTARGTVELSTNAEARTGTDTGRALTPSNISALMAESSAITPTAGTTGSFAHGLGVAPVRYEAVLVNLTAQAGWSPGQEVRASDLSLGTNPQNRTGLQVGWDGTNVYWAIALDGVLILDRSTAAMTTITPANWALRVRVFAK